MKHIPWRRTAMLLWFVALALCGGSISAFAYVGPGAGLTVLGALWGLVLAVAMSVGFVVLWPIRRLLRGRKRGSATGKTQGAEGLDGEHEMLATRSDHPEER